MEESCRRGVSDMEDRFALLIDADNVSAKYIKPILDELSKYGNVTYKRIYGDWTKSNSGRTSSKFYYADSAVQLYTGKEFYRFCHDH